MASSSGSGNKRVREDNAPPPMAARPPPAPRRPEERSPAAASPDAPWVPTRAEAYRFVKAVQREFEFSGNPTNYKEFLAVLNEFNRGRLGVPGVIDRMQAILQGHPYVIRWFNKFLPSGYELKDLQAPPRS